MTPAAPQHLIRLAVAFAATDDRADFAERTTDAGYCLDAPEFVPAGSVRRVDTSAPVAMHARRADTVD